MREAGDLSMGGELPDGAPFIGDKRRTLRAKLGLELVCELLLDLGDVGGAGWCLLSRRGAIDAAPAMGSLSTHQVHHEVTERTKQGLSVILDAARAIQFILNVIQSAVNCIPHEPPHFLI